jgi:CubicO group peptidase (beta-lactamase class C family)
MDTTQTESRYFPDADWKRKTPREAGLDPDKLKTAIDHAIAGESKTPRDLQLNHQQTFGREPFGDAIGPLKDRGPQTGVIVHKGHIVAEWGEPERIDITNSVTKSMLSTVVGLAHERGLIRSIDDTVREYVPPIQLYNPVPLANKVDRMKGSDFLHLFESEHNRRITWNHLLRQVSDWEGSLWGKPDWCDRPTDQNGWGTRARNAPGTAYEYNDVRTNVLALAALNVWRRPLPQVLKEYVFDRIGASTTWRWFGYENSWIVLDGLPVQSVSGGGHWGGGMFINAYDMARFGYLGLNRGRWKEHQVIPEQWLEWSLTPTPVQPSYGFMNWYNNKDGQLLPSAPRTAFGHRGVGDNFIYVDPDNDVVAVLRWIQREQTDGFVRKLLDATRP